MKTGRLFQKLGLTALLLAILALPALAAERTGNDWIFPVTDYTSLGCEFGCKCTTHASGSLGYHPGYDLRGSKNTMIVATKSGTVVAANNNCVGSHLNSADDCDCGNAAGNYVKIKHADGVYTICFHMNKSAVKKGDWVEQGDIIGYVGRTGNATGYHTCMEYRTGSGSGQSTATKYVNTIVSATAASNGTGDQFAPSLRRTTKSTNLLVKPNKDSTVVTVIPAGTEVLCTIVQEHWGFVTYNGQKGWVNMKTNTEQVEKAFQIDYYANGGSGKMSNSTLVLADEMWQSNNKFTKSGYYHNGWYVYASKYDKYLYTDGTNYQWAVKNKQSEGYSLAVIRDNEPINGKALASIDNRQLITLQARWASGTPANFTIKYHANGGTGTMEDMAAKRGAMNRFQLCAFENPGYRFAGWRAYRESDEKWQYVLSDGSYKWYIPGTEPEGAVLRAYEDGSWTTNTTAVDGDIIHLYAQWEEDSDAKENCVEELNIDYDAVNMMPSSVFGLPLAYRGGTDDVEFVWSSSDETVATVDADGFVTAKQEGTAIITVTAADSGKAADSCAVTVERYLMPESSHPYENDWREANVLYWEGDGYQEITFSEETYVEQYADYIDIWGYEAGTVGVYTGAELAGQRVRVEGNTAIIELYSDGENNGYGFRVTRLDCVPAGDLSDDDAPNDKALEVELTVDTVTMHTETTFDMGVGYTYWGEDPNPTFTWESSDETVVTVDQDGKLTALKEGQAVITVTADVDEASDTCVVVVDNDCYESSHPYENQNAVWVIREEGAEYLNVTFDERTCVEEEYDYINIMREGLWYECLTGKELAGKTITVEGDTLEICLYCDGSVNDWGFAITQINGVPKVPELPQIEIAGSNMNLGNELEVNFLFRIDDVTGEGYTAVVTHHYADGYTGETEYAMEDWQKLQNIYYLIPSGVAAKEMADELSVEIFDADGNVVSAPYSTSVRGYAAKALAAASGSERMKVLAVDMLNYGAEAQIYFDYNAEDLANALLTDEQQALATPDVVSTNNQIKDADFYGSSLDLGERIDLNLFFKNCTDDMYAEVVFVDYRGRTQTVEKSLLKQSGSIYRVVVDDIVLADSFCDVTVTVCNADGTVHSTVTDSVASYAARSNGSLVGPLSASVLKFADSARTYLLDR